MKLHRNSDAAHETGAPTRRTARVDGHPALPFSGPAEADGRLAGEARSRRPTGRLKSAARRTADKTAVAPAAVVELACEDNLDFLSRIPDEHCKLVVTSPPYNLGKEYEERDKLERYLDAQTRVIRECVRVLHPAGSLCWQVGNYVENGRIVPLDVVLFPVFRGFGLQMRNRIVWQFGHGLHCTRRLSGRYETINWWTKSDDYTWNLDPIRIPSKYPGKRYFRGPRVGELSCNPKGKNPSDVWAFPNVKNNHPEKTIHPCQFPVELAERLILSMTDEGDVVLDPYMGVGTTAVAALMHQRRAYGCDTVQEYVDIAFERIEQLRNGTLKTRPMDRPIYDPAKPARAVSTKTGATVTPVSRST